MDNRDLDEDDDSLVSNPPVEVELDQPCFSCGRKGVVNIVATLDLPYLGAAMQTTYICRSCGFKHSDLMTLENKGATRHEAEIRGEKDLDLRVVRSNSGTIRIPELGVDIEPGIASESFISNPEGVLDRVADVISILMKDSEQDVLQKCTALLQEVSEMKEGRLPFHLIVEDPFGNSAIIGDGVRVTSLSAEEAAQLKKGEMTFDFRSDDTDRE